MAIPLRPNELSTTTRHCLSKISSTDFLSNMKSETSNSPVKQKDNTQADDKTNLEQLENVDERETLEADISPDSKIENLKQDADDRTDGENDNPDNIDYSIDSVSGWYGKGCSKLRKKRKGGSLNKRLKKDTDNL